MIQMTGTALHYAIETNNHLLVKLLLDNRADPSIRNQFKDALRRQPAC